jgi:LuxR family maltose regulon positive regulatory protein
LTSSGGLIMATIARVGASDLRFRQDETLAVLATALGTRIGLDASVDLHELTEGWPLGVQLAAAALRRSGDIKELFAAATDDIRRYFIDFAIARQSYAVQNLLVRMAQFDTIHPDLCVAVLGGPAAAHQLLFLQDETPLVLSTEDHDWMRLHPLARHALRDQLARLPFAERQSMSRAASAWYSAHDLNEEAAQQSFLAGDVDEAISLVERSTYRMTLLGRSSAVLDWYRRLPPKALDEHSGFWAPVAWALAMSDRNAQAQPLVDRILAQPNLANSARFEADLIAATAAGFADRVDVEQAIYDRWLSPPEDARRSDLLVWANGSAFLELLRGLPKQARLQWSRIGHLEQDGAYSPVAYGFADYGTGLAYLWEGKYALATDTLRPALLRAEQRLGVRNPVTCMLAALLAEACCEGNAEAESSALLAGRMDTIEHFGLPGAIVAAYRTAARVADSQGRQDHALDLLEGLRVIGESRAMPRVQAAALYEIAYLHARHGRAETAWSLACQLQAPLVDHPQQIPAVFVPWMELHAHLALARAALARLDNTRLTQALNAAESAAALASSLKREGDAIAARFLWAETLRRQGDGTAAGVQSEAISLARVNGLHRTLREQGVASDAAVAVGTAPVDGLGATPRAESPARSIGLLTSREQEILLLLSKALSNKEIARAMSIGDETVKWHVKNLFTKLNGASRKHAVARAKLLGLLP